MLKLWQRLLDALRLRIYRVNPKYSVPRMSSDWLYQQRKANEDNAKS